MKNLVHRLKGTREEGGRKRTAKKKKKCVFFHNAIPSFARSYVHAPFGLLLFTYYYMNMTHFHTKTNNKRRNVKPCWIIIKLCFSSRIRMIQSILLNQWTKRRNRSKNLTKMYIKMSFLSLCKLEIILKNQTFWVDSKIGDDCSGTAWDSSSRSNSNIFLVVAWDDSLVNGWGWRVVVSSIHWDRHVSWGYHRGKNTGFS